MTELKVLALTHKHLPLETIGKFHLGDEQKSKVLHAIKEALQLDELLFLSTCNRIEFVMSADRFLCGGQIQRLLSIIQPQLTGAELLSISEKAVSYEAEDALRHLFEVAASLDSMVLGEREIITQVRKAFEESRAMGLSGDLIRLVIKFTLAAGKRIYTHTHIARNPVSVVSLAWKKMHQLRSIADSRLLIVGAGQMIRNLSRFIGKEQPKSVALFNRTPENAIEAAAFLKTECQDLKDLANHSEGFDILITCTGASGAVIDPATYATLLQGDKDEKLIIDLALPADVDEQIIDLFHTEYVGMETLQQVANDNIAIRAREVEKCQVILDAVYTEFQQAYKQRGLELAMRAIPEKIKEIRSTALGTVFAKDLEELDEHSLEVLEKVMAYMEKKYISLPMKMAREVMIEKIKSN